jgi:hypothetical protein
LWSTRSTDSATAEPKPGAEPFPGSVILSLLGPQATRYRDGKAWADEVQAVIDTAGLKRPVRVGWSYAGRVISDYVTNRDADGISGVDFVDASIKFVPEFVGDNLKNLPLFIVIPLIRADL